MLKEEFTCYLAAVEEKFAAGNGSGLLYFCEIYVGILQECRANPFAWPFLDEDDYD